MAIQMDTNEPSPFTQEIIANIFLKLPIKSLKRFQSVSKSCYSIINSQNFINAHLKNRSGSLNNLLVHRFHNPTGSDFSLSLMDYRKPTISREIKIPFLGSLIRYPRIVGSVNGLLCLDISPIHCFNFILWNISIVQFRVLPRPKIAINDVKNPIWMVATGFGSNQESDDYKLVRIVYFACDDISIRAEVYSWRTNSWKILDLDEKIGDFSISNGQNGVYFNGCLYWLANGIGDFVNRKYVISFDLGSENFTRIKIPEYSGAICAKVLEFQNSLALAFYPAANVYPGYGRSLNRIELWVYADYDCGIDDDANSYKQWTRVYYMNMDLNSAHMGYPISVHNDDGEVVFKRVSADYVNLAFLNPNNHSIKTVPICHSEYTCQFYNYTSSLVPVTVFGE
ncbi:F-box/kelch-repeat protein At3g06240-like [Mercurialis annua]|uniref:F-box/kelch-repeat protein At3g06240-like n=1 Tax=Mercurialis annua TaxID=3986 RepID=UPI0024ADACB5|nr:F-box/kelch-repeat protein At3g06240-like [Mercurialis annua]